MNDHQKKQLAELRDHALRAAQSAAAYAQHVGVPVDEPVARSIAMVLAAFSLEDRDSDGAAVPSEAASGEIRHLPILLTLRRLITICGEDFLIHDGRAPDLSDLPIVGSGRVVERLEAGRAWGEITLGPSELAPLLPRVSCPVCRGAVEAIGVAFMWQRISVAVKA